MHNLLSESAKKFNMTEATIQSVARSAEERYTVMLTKGDYRGQQLNIKHANMHKVTW